MIKEAIAKQIASEVEKSLREPLETLAKKEQQIVTFFDEVKAHIDDAVRERIDETFEKVIEEKVKEYLLDK